MDRSIVGKVGAIVVLLTWSVLLVAPSAHSGGFVGGIGGIVTGGFAGGGGFPIGGLGGIGTGGFGGLGGIGGFTGGSAGAAGSTDAVPQPSSLVLTMCGLGIAAWGVWRNRR